MPVQKGDFTHLAKHYHSRPGYSHAIIEQCFAVPDKERADIIVADIGAGTGKFTKELCSLGFRGYALEPNEAMLQNRDMSCSAFEWSIASAERTFLPDDHVDFITMASSFHWTDQRKALKEFYRILKPQGKFIAIWNPRDLSACPLQMEIDQWIRKKLNNYSRVSSGSNSYTKYLEKDLLNGGYFSRVLTFEGTNLEKMSRERYLEVWKSVNDIQAQAGEKIFAEILAYIQDKVAKLEEIVVPYKTRAFVATTTKTLR